MKRSLKAIISRVVVVVRNNIGVLGAFGYSAANFLLAFFVQSEASPEAFGLFVFSLILVQFGISVSNALFASPITSSLADPGADPDEVISGYAVADAIFLVVGGSAFALSLWLLGAQKWFIALSALQGMSLWARWFLRAIELGRGEYLRPALADFGYACVTMVVGAGCLLHDGPSVSDALIAMASGSVSSLAFMSSRSIGSIMRGRLRGLGQYRAAFSIHGKWALIGVVTTEITANAHSYAISAFMGPAVFAPVALVSLFFRPIPILTQALTQYRRPVFARLLRDKDVESVTRQVVRIRIAVITATLLNGIAVASILCFAPSVIGDGYEVRTLLVICAFLTATQVSKAINTGSSAALQGGGFYKPLALVTAATAPITLLMTVAALCLAPFNSLGALGAVFLGETTRAVLAAMVYRRHIRVQGA